MSASLSHRLREHDPRVSRIAWRGLLGLMLLVAVSHFAWVTVHHVEWLGASGENRLEVPDYVAFYSAGQLVWEGKLTRSTTSTPSRPKSARSPGFRKLSRIECRYSAHPSSTHRSSPC